MKKRMIVLVAAAITAFGAMGFAHAGEELAGAAGIYVADDGVWSESNGLAGLQRSATGTTPADTKTL